MAKPVLEIDGRRTRTLNAFFKEVSQALIPGKRWGRSLDAFNDILRGGFGTPAGGFILRWVRSDRAREHLGETLFATLVEIIRVHGPGGAEATDGVELELA
jgi:RNAse (barnase) inhibitor barstar